MLFKGVNGKLPCRFCKIEATLYTSPGGHSTYYTTLAPDGKKKYDPYRLPLRTDRQIKDTVRKIHDCRTGVEKSKLETNEGISGDVR